VARQTCRSRSATAAARDLAPDVRVNAVAPGGVRDGAQRSSAGGQTTPVIDDPDALADRLAHRTLFGPRRRLVRSVRVPVPRIR